MLINSTHDYALRMCCHLARNGGRASTREMAEAVGVSRAYLTQIAQPLRDAGILTGHAGKCGGYSLALPPGEASVLDVLRAVDEAREPGELGEEAAYVKRQMLDVLDGITLLEAM